MRILFRRCASSSWALLLTTVLLVAALAPVARAGTGSIGSPIDDFGRDDNGNGLYDELVVTVPITVTTPGNFYVDVQLSTLTSTWITYDSMFTYLGGPTTVEMELSGVAIRQAGFDGPYLAAVYLYDADGNFTFIDSKTHTTNAYLARDFETTPIAFAPPHADQGVDLNGNGLYDFLQLQVHLDVSTAGDYLIQGAVQDPTFTYMDYLTVPVHLDAGPATVLLNYSALGISSKGVDGPYVANLYAMDPFYDVLDTDSYWTQAYSAASFEQPPVALAPPFADVGIDTDGDGLFNTIQVQVPVSVAAPATFQVFVALTGLNGTPALGNRAKTVTLEPGLATINLDLSTIPIVAAGLDGPYQVRIDLAVDDVLTGNWYQVDSQTFLTAAYLVSQFDGIPAQLGPTITDLAVDRDVPPDGLYDVLTATATVEVQEPGNYIVEGILYDSGYWDLYYDDLYLALPAGNHTVTLTFPGVDISAHGYSGTFFVDVSLWVFTGGRVSMIDEAWHETASYNAADFESSPPAVLDGYLLDAGTGYPVPYTSVEAFNYHWLKSVWTMTDASGYYSFPIEEGTWVVTAEPYETLEQALAQVDVVAPSASLNFDLLPVVGQPAYVNLTFSDWGNAARDRAWIFTYQAATARQYYDWWNGNRDGYLTDQEYLDALGAPGSLPTPLPAVSADLFSVDGGAYDLVPGSNTYTPGDIAGSIFDPRPMTGIETGAYTTTSGPEPAASHTVLVNITYDLPWNDRVYRVSLPEGYIATSVSAPPDIAVSGLGTRDLILDPPVGENPDGTTWWSWATITASVEDLSPPTIDAMEIAPAPAELGQTAAISAHITDDTGVQLATLEIWDPDGISLGNITWTGTGDVFAHEFVPEKLGTYTYTIFATDVLNGAVAHGTFDVVDTTPPSIVTAAATPDPTELGAETMFAASLSDVGGVDRASVEVRDPSGALLGNFSLTFDTVAEEWRVPQTFSEVGTYTYTVWAVDPSGNAASTSGSFDVADTTPPILAEVSATPDPAEFQETVTFAFAASDLGGVTSASVDVWDASDALVGTYPMSFNLDTGHWEASQAFASLGTYTFTVTALDASGNPQTASGSFVVRDTLPPEITGAAASPGTVEFAGSVVLSADVTDLIAVDTVTVEVRDASDNLVGNFTMAAGIGDSFAYTLTPDALGTFTYTITATDSSGNVMVVTGSFAVEDTTPPNMVSVVVEPTPVELGGPIQFTVRATDLVAIGSVTIEIRNGQGDLVGNFTMASGTTGAYTQSVTPSTLGTYTYTITVTDSSGNARVVTGSFVVRDTTPPTVSSPSATPTPGELGSAVHLSVQVTDLAPIASVHVELSDPDGTVVGNYSMAPGAGHSYAYTLTPSKLGTYTYTITATDSSGNVKVVTGSFVVQDSTAPIASAGADQSVTQGSTVAFDGSASTDNDAVASYAWTFTDGGTKTLTGAHPTYTFTHPGTYTVTLTVMDPSGNVATDTMTVTVTAVAPTTGSISGTVKDDSGLVVANATVTLLSGSTVVATTTSDSQGRFTFANVAPGSYTLRATAADFDAGTANVTVVAGQTAQAAITLTLTPVAPAGGPDWVPILAIGVIVAAVAVAAGIWYLRRGKK